MRDWFEKLKDDAAVIALTQGNDNLVLNSWDEALVIARSFISKPRNMIIIKNNLYSAQQLYHKLVPLLDDKVLLLAMEESLRVEEVASTPTMYAAQMDTITRIVLNADFKVLVTHPMGIVRYLPEKEVFRNHIIHLNIGQEIAMNELRRMLVNNGYHYVSRVDKPLTFSIRGDVIDVFSIQNDTPVRIEFFDEEVDSIRYFDSASQRTIQQVDQVDIVPASLLIYDEDFTQVEDLIHKQLEHDYPKCSAQLELENNINQDIEFLRSHYFEQRLYRYYCFFSRTTSILNYFSEKDIILISPEEIQDNVKYLQQDMHEYIQEQFESGMALNYYSLTDLFDHLMTKEKIINVNNGLDDTKRIISKIVPSNFPLLPLSSAIDIIIELSRKDEVYLLVSDSQKSIIENAFKDVEKEIPKNCHIELDGLIEGFEYEKMQVVTSQELFGKARVSQLYENKFNAAVALDNYQELQPNDYVVHAKYGIGQYLGIETREVKGVHRDYLKIRYRDDGMLMVPLEQFQLVRKYVSSEGVGIRLSKLGTNSWTKAKERIQQDVENVASRLLQLYVDREQEIGFAYQKDDEYQAEFENNFEYVWTADQARSIKEIKDDMEKPRPMDRLLCGDVGFGKTEVAMVAAFKAVNNGKQVAYLCPTTILSRQHYGTFIERFKGFPIKIALLNRFVEPQKQKEIIKEVKKGNIDILIGTHRILSEDIQFYDLGFLIIDEEQRFGVQAKEKIKEMKHSIDCLSLSATPIPRTLQMSLTGVMSLSQIETPPLNRNPIQTYVVEQNDKLIKEVIQRELARNGQIFYLHNDISTIYVLATKLHIMLPEARIAVAHGKMTRDEIEDVMYAFVNNEYDILLCTTIIETGIDIPNANTVIIENADLFGLSQLYQIRGRVGRSDRIAYAYLMYAKDKQLSEVASKRLKAIKDFTELGSGYKIAMRDLTIRGAGDLLGAKQAGFIDTVGMDLYLEMLQNAINQKKGLQPEIVETPKAVINAGDGYLPEDFTEHDYEKITLYQDIDKCRDIKSLSALQEEITDRYGKLPASVNLLFEKKRVEILLKNPNIERFDELDKECRVVLTRTFSAHLDGIRLFKEISNVSSEIKLKNVNRQIHITIQKKKKWLNQVAKVIQVIDGMS